MWGVYGLDATGLKGSVKILTVLLLGDGLDAVMVNQAFEIFIKAAFHHPVCGGVYWYCPVSAVSVL